MAKLPKVTSREHTVVPIEDKEGRVVAKLYGSQVGQRGAGECLVITCPFWAAVPRRGPTSCEVAAVPFLQVKCPSTHNCLVQCHVH